MFPAKAFQILSRKHLNPLHKKNTERKQNPYSTRLPSKKNKKFPSLLRSKPWKKQKTNFGHYQNFREKKFDCTDRLIFTKTDALLQKFRIPMNPETSIAIPIAMESGKRPNRYEFHFPIK